MPTHNYHVQCAVADSRGADTPPPPPPPPERESREERAERLRREEIRRAARFRYFGALNTSNLGEDTTKGEPLPGRLLSSTYEKA